MKKEKSLTFLTVLIVFFLGLQPVLFQSGQNPGPIIKIRAYSYKTAAQESGLPGRSPGLSNVGIGKTVRLAVENLPAESHEIIWRMQAPPDSRSAISKISPFEIDITLDSEGSYLITVEIPTGAEKSRFAEIWINAAVFVGNGGDVRTGNPAQCIHCHSAIVKTWKSTGHATIFQRGINGKLPSGKYDSSCLECHAAGFEREVKAAAWEEAEKFDNFGLPRELQNDNFSYFLKRFPERANLTGIQCESCHGPGGLHQGETAQGQIAISMNSAVCAVCHEFSEKTSTVSQYFNSPHMRSMDTPEERITMNTEGCARCHTTQGYWKEIIEGKTSVAPYPEADGIHCITCHDPHNRNGGEVLLRTGTAGRACTGCHDILVQNDEQGFSSCPQGALLRGKGGREAAEQSYPTGKHTSIKKLCAGCHMAKAGEGADPERVGGHTTRVITKNEELPMMNSQGCLGCHNQIDLQWVRRKQSEFHMLLKTLADLLPKQKDGTPRFPADPSLSDVQAAAAFNYWTILKDGSFGVHNPVYIRSLLEDSIKRLQSE